MHVDQCQHPVFVAIINTSRFHQATFEIRFHQTHIGLPVWTDGEGTVVFSVSDAARHLSIDFRVVQASEWLAIFDIPPHLIVQRLDF